MNSQYDGIPDKGKKIAQAVCDGVRRYEHQLAGKPYSPLVDVAMISSIELKLHNEFSDAGHEWAVHGGMAQYNDAHYYGTTTLGDAISVISALLHSETDESYADALVKAQDMLDEYAEGL